ncbi:ribokinase [Virgibacillus pantothenticus]|uniref:Ribokinase n=1 Tax=Virgibacillus pantothenticus TaxID=1473 RepID=A0A0L0QLF2_VIRPA|nr:MULTISPECIES: ribokinase [Virgibacillus]API91602.1 ribokinase [Virgibacillus sp. 6R]KNE19349.1 ribokinase [Virgibacillus pantothenticus]MBS7426877.1 ribokinase [Virgibacillus sp. 19R1-5]MBU8568323.1 ribokinase [Virgibacillus pantothenticus]MBU8602228.1 ribokinase [Virgibacillus pantothenticus]
MGHNPKICVVGSINMDLTIETTKLPQQGETVLGQSFALYPGGKGANQAVAAARLGAKVHMIGAVGKDEFGKLLTEQLQREGIHTQGIILSDQKSTGVANIILSEDDNRIIVAPGANYAVVPEVIEQQEEVIRQSDMVLLQLEIPLSTVLYTVKKANQYHIPVVVNPAPYQQLPEELLQNATYFTPNEIEAAAMEEEPLYNSIREKMIVTMGSEGVCFYEHGNKTKIKSFTVDVKDTTGAGDTFNGALVTQLARGNSMSQSINFANAAAALSIMKTGAQEGMPTLDMVHKFIHERGI